MIKACNEDVHSSSELRNYIRIARKVTLDYASDDMAGKCAFEAARPTIGTRVPRNLSYFIIEFPSGKANALHLKRPCFDPKQDITRI